jgi:hypothetical protein
MSDVSNAILALKNAWTGAVAASDAVRALTPAVEAIPADATLEALDLADYHRLTLAQANAVQALRGLVEGLQRDRDAAVA